MGLDRFSVCLGWVYNQRTDPTAQQETRQLVLTLDDICGKLYPVWKALTKENEMALVDYEFRCIENSEEYDNTVGMRRRIRLAHERRSVLRLMTVLLGLMFLNSLLLFSVLCTVMG